jgi:uncharacterized protein
MKKLSAVEWVALIILVVGGLNWGLVGLFGLDVVATVFGDMSAVSRAVYVLVGLAAVWVVFMTGKLGKQGE